MSQEKLPELEIVQLIAAQIRVSPPTIEQIEQELAAELRQNLGEQP